MADLDLRAVMARYSRALDAQPSKGPWEDEKVAWITDSVCDVPQLLAEIDRLEAERTCCHGLTATELCNTYPSMREIDETRGRMVAAEAEVQRLRAQLADFAEHGTRHDLTPTMPGGEQGLTHLLRYIRRMDDAVRDRARRVLATSGPESASGASTSLSREESGTPAADDGSTGRCTSDVTLRDEEHRLVRCWFMAGHPGPHADGAGVSWTDREVWTL